MRQILLFTLLIFPLFIHAQTETKPPKLRIEHGFFVTKYELGDKTTPHEQVASHLKIQDTDSYIYWKAADRADMNGLVWSVVGLGGLLVGVLSEKTESRIAGFGGAAVAMAVSLVCEINGKSKRQKAIDTYNQKFGY